MIVQRKHSPTFMLLFITELYFYKVFSWGRSLPTRCAPTSLPGQQGLGGTLTFKMGLSDTVLGESVNGKACGEDGPFSDMMVHRSSILSESFTDA